LSSPGQSEDSPDQKRQAGDSFERVKHGLMTDDGLESRRLKSLPDGFLSEVKEVLRNHQRHPERPEHPAPEPAVVGHLDHAQASGNQQRVGFFQCLYRLLVVFQGLKKGDHGKILAGEVNILQGTDMVSRVFGIQGPVDALRVHLDAGHLATGSQPGHPEKIPRRAAHVEKAIRRR